MCLRSWGYRSITRNWGVHLVLKRLPKLLHSSLDTELPLQFLRFIHAQTILADKSQLSKHGSI